MKLLAIDYGEAKIGVAVSDEAGKIALPYKILENKGFDFVLKELEKICREEDIERIIVGRPLGLEGQVTEQTKITDEFIKKLREQIDIPVEVEDERLTSKAAQRLTEGKEDHSVAAMVILRDWMERG